MTTVRRSLFILLANVRGSKYAWNWPGLCVKKSINFMPPPRIERHNPFRRRQQQQAFLKVKKPKLDLLWQWPLFLPDWTLAIFLLLSQQIARSRRRRKRQLRLEHKKRVWRNAAKCFVWSACIFARLSLGKQRSWGKGGEGKVLKQILDEDCCHQGCTNNYLCTVKWKLLYRDSALHLLCRSQAFVENGVHPFTRKFVIWPCYFPIVHLYLPMPFFVVTPRERIKDTKKAEAAATFSFVARCKLLFAQTNLFSSLPPSKTFHGRGAYKT